MRDVGYDIQVLNTPMNATLIKGKFLQRAMQVQVCCYEKELLNLYAYTLMDQPIIVQLDVDPLILSPLGIIYDAMIDSISAVDLYKLPAAGGTPLLNVRTPPGIIKMV